MPSSVNSRLERLRLDDAEAKRRRIQAHKVEDEHVRNLISNTTTLFGGSTPAGRRSDKPVSGNASSRIASATVRHTVSGRSTPSRSTPSRYTPSRSTPGRMATDRLQQASRTTTSTPVNTSASATPVSHLASRTPTRKKLSNTPSKRSAPQVTVGVTSHDTSLIPSKKGRFTSNVVPIIGKPTGSGCPSASSFSGGAVVPSGSPVSTTSFGSASASGAAGLMQSATDSRHQANYATPSAPVSLLNEPFRSQRYRISFNLQGPYTCMATVQSTGALWGANRETGALDVYSGVTGQLIVSLPPNGSVGGALGMATLARPPRCSAAWEVTKNASFFTSTTAVSNRTFVEPETPSRRPTALQAAATHMWVGYDDGSVVVYDHLVLLTVTEGCFHSLPIAAFCVLKDGTVVSASSDGVLVRWGDEEHNFEAIKRVETVSSGLGQITCIAAASPAMLPVMPGCCRNMTSSTSSCLTELVCCGYDSGAIAVVDTLSGWCKLVLKEHHNRINCLTVMGDVLFSASMDCTVRIWSFHLNKRFDVMPNGMSSFPEKSPATVLTATLRKVVPVTPSVRAFLPEYRTWSLWVAFANGLLERRSANLDDEFSVEAVIQEAVIDASECDGQHDMATQQPTREVTAMHALSVVETLQVLSLSSNGVHKVWYAHKNALEENLQQSLDDLNAVISQDAQETAAWRERAQRLHHKEKVWKRRYVVILEQLAEQKMMLRYFEHWRRCILRKSSRLSLSWVQEAAARTNYCLMGRYFAIWASFYDLHQRRMRRFVFAQALEDAARRSHVSSVLQRWQMVMVKRKVRQTYQVCVDEMAAVSRVVVIARYYLRWKMHVETKQKKASTRCELTKKMELLASKAQQQLIRHALQAWLLKVQQKSKWDRESRAVQHCAEAYAKMNSERHAHGCFLHWRVWTQHRQRRAPKRAVAVLRAKEAHFRLSQRYYMYWLYILHVKKLHRRSAEITVVEEKLRAAESQHGDIFDKLQLQKHIDKLILQQEVEDQQLRQAQKQLEEMTYECDRLRNQATGQNTIGVEYNAPSSSAVWCQQQVDQQRLSPTVLQHMPLRDAIHHVMCQLKGTIINLYTDVPLFRQAKDVRRAGTTAARIFLESFGEVKRLVVSTVKIPVKAGGRNTRWPLSVEVLENIPVHLSSGVLNAAKMMVIAFDLLNSQDAQDVQTTFEEVVGNADWIFLIARTCYALRRPLLPANNRLSNLND